MTTTTSTISLIFAAVFIGGLTSSPASAAVAVYGWSDVSSVTHKGSRTSDVTQVGHSSGEFGKNDLSTVTHQSVEVTLRPLLIIDYGCGLI